MKIVHILASLSLCSALVTANAAPVLPPEASGVEAHNVQAKHIYDQLKNKYLENTDPLIIAWQNRLSFYHHHHLHEYPIVSKQYSDLKGIAHVTLAVFALFHPLNQFPKNKPEVMAYQQVMMNTEKKLDKLGLSPQQQQRQKNIFSLTQGLLKQALSRNAMPEATLARFFEELSPMISENINEATKLEISALNQQMTKIQAELGPRERQALFVVIPVSKMPRQDNIVGQFFSKYLGVPVDSERLIYAEGLSSTEAILSLVATWQLDSSLSTAFFHDPDRMKKDLVAEHARSYLDSCSLDETKKMALVCDS